MSEVETVVAMPTPKVSQEPRQISETSRSLEPRRR